jgi:mRNA interferase RelE/StbE
LAWTIRILESANKRLRKLDRQAASRIKSFLTERVAVLDDPRMLGDQLTGSLKQYWRYRVGDYRILCQFENNELVVLVVDIGHRSDIYR